METQTVAWVVFNVLVLSALALDLIVFHRRPHALGIKEALAWVALWVSLAAGFAGLIAYWKGADAALQFATGYLVEESLSVDNMFVFLMIFSYFGVPRAYQHRVLFWGIFGALVMRAVMIFSGVALINRFHWVLYVFGAFLVFTGIKMALQKDKEIHPEANPVLRLVRRLLPVSEGYNGGSFLTKRGGRLALTPLFVVLVMIETTDLVFALDSIPAVLAISRDAFIVYTSNVFAILGLRALFFAACRGDGVVPISQLRAGGDSGFHRRQDAGRRGFPDSRGHRAGRGRVRPVDLGGSVAAGKAARRAGRLSQR